MTVNLVYTLQCAHHQRKQEDFVMTIKEVEQHLEVPRATVRFYEKEGLINPQ